MFELAWHETKIRYWRYDLAGLAMSIPSIILTALAVYIYIGTSELKSYILAAVAGIAGYLLFLCVAYVVVLFKRWFWVGYLRLYIAYRNGIVQNDGSDYLCINIDSLETREHNVDLHFRCYGRFFRVWEDGTKDDPIIFNNIQFLSFSPQLTAGKSFEYGNIPDGDNVIYFARVWKERRQLIFFTTTTKLATVGKGIYNVDIVVGGICKELDKSITRRVFKGRIIFDGEIAKLEYRNGKPTKAIRNSERKSKKRKKSSLKTTSYISRDSRQ